MKKIRALKDIPIQTLIPLLVVVVLAASGAKHNPQRESDVVKWQRVLEEATPAQDHLAERDALARRQAQVASLRSRLETPLNPIICMNIQKRGAGETCRQLNPRENAE
jgi:hypothetical protein